MFTDPSIDAIICARGGYGANKVIPLLDYELIKTTLRVANGRLTCAEALGHKEFVMTKLYRSA